MKPICQDQLVVCMQYVNQMKTQIDEADLICEAKIESKLNEQQKKEDHHTVLISVVAFLLIVQIAFWLIRRKKKSPIA